MLKLITLAAVLAFGAGTAVAQTPPSATAAPSAKAEEDPDKKICERVEEIGTRLGAKRVCKTKSEWAAERAEHRNDMERAQRNSGILSGS